MAKKTFVNPFATVGFNQGNYTPYEQQNLLDAEENDRLYQEYLNSGMAQQGFQPQDNSSAIGRGLTAGAAGVIEGQAQLANLLGVGDGQMVQYLQKINRNNARKKEYSIADMIPFASDYWTNTEGAAYDVANMLGSSGAMMAETAALMTGAGAIGGALGLGGGAAATAGGGLAGALSRGSGLAPNAVKKLAEKMATAANNRGYTKLGKALEGPMGQMYALNILKTPVEVSSEAGSAGADALAEGADVWEARKRAGITALVQAPLLAMSNTIEAANLGGLFSKEIGKKATKEAIIGLLGDITKDGLQNAWEEGMQQSSQEYAAGKQSLLGVVNPFQWSPEALQEAAVGAVGGMALGGGNAILGTVMGDRETRQPSTSEQPTQEATPIAPAPTPTAAEEQTIDTDKITPKGARAFLENAQSEMPAGEEYNAITELLDTGSDEDIISKATSMGYGQKETPTQQQQAEQPAEQPTAQPVEQPVEQPTTQPVEQQAEQPVGTPAAEQEDWATAQINDAIAMIPTQARAKLMNKDGSINWDKVNSDKNVQKALNNPKGVETAIKAINGDEKARNTMKSWGAKKKAAIIHAAQQQMAGQGATQQPVQQEAIKPVEQPAPKPEAKPVPQGDEQNAQAQNQNNSNQNQGVNPQPQQSQTPEADDQGQGQNGQTEQVKPTSAPVQQFKDTLGDYVVDEYGFNNDNTRSYVHKSDDGKDVQRVATIQRTKDGKYSASKNSSDKVAEPKIFDTLEEAEAFIAGKKTSKPTTKTTTAKPEPKKEVKPEPAPESKPTTVADDDVNIDEVNKRIADRVERYGAENAPMVAIAAEKQEAEDADKKLNKLRNKPRGSILSTLVNGSSMHKFKDALLQRYYHGWTPADVTIKGLEAVLNGDAVKGLPEAAQKLAKKYITGMIDRVKEYDKAHPEHAQKIADYQKEQGGLRTDENGIVLLSTTMNAEEAKAQREANDKVLLAKGEEIKQAYIRDTMTADEARAAITALTSKYNKIKNMPPVSKDALKKLANIRSWILSDNKERSKGVKLTDKERADSMLADAQEEIDKAFKVYGGVGAADKEAISAYKSLKKNIQTAKVVFYSNLESEGLKPLKKYEKVFEDAFDKVNGMIEKAENKRFYEEYNTTFKQRIENAFKEAESWEQTPEELREAIKGIYNDFSEKFKKFRKYIDNELFPLAAPYALGRSKDRTEERVKEYEKQYNEAHQEQQEQAPFKKVLGNYVKDEGWDEDDRKKGTRHYIDKYDVNRRLDEDRNTAVIMPSKKAGWKYDVWIYSGSETKDLLHFNSLSEAEDYLSGKLDEKINKAREEVLVEVSRLVTEEIKKYEKGEKSYEAVEKYFKGGFEGYYSNRLDEMGFGRSIRTGDGFALNAMPLNRLKEAKRLMDAGYTYEELHPTSTTEEQTPSAEPDADGFVDAGAYVNSQLGENFMEDLFSGIDATREQNDGGKKGTKNTTKGTKPPADQAIEADIQEQQVADQVATNEVVFPEIEAAIDSIPGRERATITKYFDQHPEARYVISERLKKGVELFKVPYKDKSGKDNSVYYAKEAGSDEYVKVSKAEAIVMSKVGELEIKETTKDAMNKEKKAKYVTEISEDEDWEYADALEEGKIEGVKKGDKKAVNIIMDFLTIEFADGKGCPFDKTVKTWAEWVRKVALFDAERKNEGLSLDALWNEDNPAKLTLTQKDSLNYYYEYLYTKYENKVEDKSRQKKDLEVDMVEQTTTSENNNVESEPVPDQAFIDQLDDIFSNSGLKFKVTDKEPLDSYNPNLLGQVINLGQMAINNYKAKTSEAWHKFMNNAIQSAKKMSAGLKNFATRLLDSVWEYLSNLPSTVSFDAKNLQKTVQNIVNSMGIAKQAYDGGYNYREVSNQLKNSQPKRWEALKDYLAAAFRAIDFYPKKVVESNYGNNGGDGNVDVRTSQQSAQGNSGRGNGNGLEANSGNNGRGNQMGGGQTAQGETNQEFNQRPVQEESGTPISGSGSAAGRKQGYQQSGSQKPNDSASVSGNSNGGRGAGTGQNRSTGNPGGLEQNLSQAQRNARHQADSAAGKTLSELKFNKEPFKAADEQGIAKAVPTLLPEQLKDVVAIEKRLFKKNGKGMLVANGTGTGKTMTGLGEIVRFLQKGARKILIVVPSSNIRDNWVDDGAKVGLPSSAFATITTGKVAPDAINIITYKAFSENQNILKESWDLVVMDECQWVSSGAKSDENERTNTAQTLRAISGHERTGFEDYMQSKYRKEYRELKKLGDKLKKSKKALTNLVAQFGAFGQPVNQLKANIKSMEDKQKALRRKLDIAEQKERKEYDKRLLARKEDTRVLLLSATPFAYSNSIYYAEGLLFNYDKGGYEDYMVDQFGYERKQDGTVRIQRVMGTSIPMPNHILEAKWHDMLVDSGAMINRRLEIQQDYNRRFVKVDGGIGAEIDKGFEILKDYRKGDLNQILAERFEYSKRCRLLEAIKADAAIPMIKEYLKQGKKVVIFHDYKSKDPVGHPFKLDKEELTKLSQDARDEYERLKKEHPELFLLEVNAFHNVDQTLEQEFKGKMAAINGDISFDKRTQIVKAFNNDNSGLDIVSVVAEAGKEGISLHDTTGNHPRVLINLGMPTRPTSSIQIEGRIYRLGQKSNAQIRYLYTDTKIEQKAFVDYISARTRTAETLALGDASRNLDGAFAIGYLASKTEKGDFNAANDTVDTGGKLYDTMSKEELETAMKQMYEQLNADGAVDEDMKAKLAERIQGLEDERNAKKREEILTEQNEKKVLATIKEAVAGNKVTKVADGVYVVEFVGGARNLWIDLNNSQAAILSKMTEEQKRSMLSAADIKGSEYEIGGYYTKEANSNIGAVVDIIRLTEVATTHTLDHEIMHFVHNALLKTLEKQHLEKYFKMLLKKQIGEDAYNKLTEEERLARCEEMEADAYAAFCAEDRKPKNMVERILWKMQKWFAQFFEKFGVETPMGIYIRVRSGEMYGRRDNLSGEEIAQRIRDAGIKPTKIAKTLYQAAWHGTPYIFDEFDNEHNGSGEGPNAHGWGLYFAKNRAVSEEYRERLTQDLPSGLRISLKNGEKYTVTAESQNGVRSGEIEVVNSQGNYVLYEENPPLYSALNYLISANGDLQRTLRRTKALLVMARESYSKEQLAEVKGAIRYLEEELADARIEVDSKAGALLNVSIPENDVLLNENKTFEQQPFRVRQALARLFSRTKITPNRYANDIKSYIQGFKVDNQDNVDELLSNIKFALDEFNKSVSELASKSTFNSALFNRKYSDLREELKDNLGEAIHFFVNDSTEELSGKTLEQHQKEDGWIFDQGFYDEWADGNLTIARNEYINEILHSLTRSENFDADGKYLSIFPLESVNPDTFLPKKTGRKILRLLENALGSSKEASLALSKVGIKGIHYIGERDGECFVVFDAASVAIKERYDLALQNNKDLIERSYKECENEMRKAFPNGKFTPIDASRWLVELKGGARYEIGIKDRIIVNAAEEAKARKDHGLKGKAGEVAITGKYQGITEDIVDGVISLSRKSNQGTGYHEVYHAAWDAVLNEKEKAALLKEYEAQAKTEGRNVQEVIADAVMNNTLKRQANDSRILSRVKQRVLDFAYALKALFTRVENVHNVMRKIEQGEVWSRTPNELQQTASRYQAAGVKAKTANLDKLSVAEKMEKQDKSREEIFDATGWWRAEDGKWRFEIKDDIDKIDARYFKKATRVPLNKLYHNEELYKAYPKLNGIRVEFIKNKDKSHFGHFSEAEQTIYINLLGREPNELTLFHELQHVIQRLEGHGNGAGTEIAKGIAVANELMAIEDMANGDIAVLQAFRTSVIMPFVDPRKASKAYAASEKYQKALTPQQEALFNKMMDKADEVDAKSREFSDWQYYADYAGEREARQAAYRGEPDGLWYPWDSLDELETGSPIVSFGKELDWIENSRTTALNSQEQLDGSIKFSVKPVDKVDSKGVPDNLDNVVDNKESLEDVKPHGTVQETLRDAQKLGEKNEVEGGIVVKEPKVDKSRDIGLLDNYLHSPSHLAKKNPIFKAFYDIFKKAQSAQEKLRNRWLGQLDGAYKMLKSKEDADTYHNLMVDGDLKAKEYSMQELADMGIKDNVAKAYLHTRQMIRNIWEKVNDAHRGLVYRTEKLSAKKVEELSKKPFIENIMVRVVKIGVDNTDAYQPLSEVKLNDKATYEVKYGQPHVFKDTKTLTQEQLDELKASPYAHVVKEEEYKEVEGLKLFKAEVEQVAPPIGKIAGYLPHIFEQWLILVETEQGSVPVSSGKNVKEAVKIAESLQKDAPNVQFYIVPKMFNPSNVLGEDVAEGSVGGASIVLSAEDFSKLEKSISNTFKMSLAEAREALKPVAKKEGKSRFLGSLLHRKGRVGYNTDIADSLSRYIYMTSRYVALQPAKVKAFSLFERTFHGTLGEDYSRTDQLAHVTKNYILHCNGTPNHLETLLTGWLNMIPFWRNYVSTNFGDRSLMSITGRVNGLLSMSLLGGYNISSAVVGLSQLANVYAQIGSRFLGEGMYAYKRMNLRDKRILAETGILYDIGLDTASGFTKRRKLLGGEGDSGLAKAYKFVSYYGDKGMYFFKKADEATRGIAALGAYYKGIEDGMSHKQAIAYAKKVNRDSNFDYGAADAPAIYQRLSGTGIGDLMLLFQKYPIKQFEFMQQMLPYFGSAKKAEKIRFWGAYFLMAGLAGIPLGDWLDELLAKVLGYKPTTAVKSYLFTEFGDNIGTRTLAYGVLSNLGVDVSRRIGMANLAPQGDSVWETALGPGLNILYRMAQSGSDDWAKTIKAFNPSLGNMAEGIRGYKTNSKNQINYIYGDMEKFFKAAGFRTTGESIASDLQSAVYLDKQQKKDARQKLMMQMVKKRIDGEALTPEDYKTLREQGITGAQFQKAVKAAKMTALQRTRAGMTKQQKKDFAGTLVMEEDE